MISIIVFAHNEELYLTTTLNQVYDALIECKITDYEIIFVDDGSNDQTMKIFIDWKKNYKNIISLKNSIRSGINFSIKKALKECKFEKVLCVPGHFMFSSPEISKVLKLCGVADVVLGFRTNKRKERPIIKRISSRVLLDFFRTFVYKNVFDIHGLNIFPKKILEVSFENDFGHGNHIIPLAISLRENLDIVQVPVKIRNGHKKRIGRNIKTEVPSISSAFNVFCQVLRARKLVKSNFL